MPKKDYLPSLVAIDRDLVYSQKAVWIYLQLPAQPYEFMDAKSREDLAMRLHAGLESLITKDSDKSVEAHLIVTSVPFDVNSWHQAIDLRTETYDPSPYWFKLSAAMSRYMQAHEFRSKKVYLGILLGNRSQYNSTTTLGNFGQIASSFTNKYLRVKDQQISDKELAYWQNKAHQIRLTLTQGNLNAKRIRSNVIAHLVKETLWPSMDIPAVSASDGNIWGRGEIEGLGVSGVYNNKKFLRIDQTDAYGKDKSGYKATLCFSRFPEVLAFPQREPWIHYASILSAPATIYSRFTIEPSSKVRRDVSRKKKELKDQIGNVEGAGNAAPQQLYEQAEAVEELEYRLTKDRYPWIHARHRLVITAPTETLLRERAQEVIERYKDLEIDLVWPSGDQLSFLLESQPGDRVRVGAYIQRQDLAMIPIGMPSGSGTVGDNIVIDPETGKQQGWLGPYIGKTTSRVEEPVFLSIHAAIAKNNPPGLVITGAPGGGKSFSAFTLTYLMALQGVWTIYIDPKGDALPIADLPGLEGRVKKFDLRYGHDGLLDPFGLADTPERAKLLALETLNLFQQGGLRSAEQGSVIPIITRITELPNPSLGKVVDELQKIDKKEDPAGFALGQRLELIRNVDFARLCFAPNDSKRQTLSAEDGLTLISLQGLDLPPSNKNEEYTLSNLLAVGLMYLLTSYTESLMNSKDKSHPKAVVIDESWAVVSTPQGRSMIPRLTRLGRALNTAVILVSQNAGDFLDLTSNMSFRMAFRATDAEEIKNVLAFFQMEYNDANVRVLRELRNGECLMKDADGIIQRVQIDAWDENQKRAFDTNPETRGKVVAQ